MGWPMLVDHAVIEVEGGKGGNGAVSFRRELLVPKGGPDGGDGGRGGSVWVKAVDDVDTLVDMAERAHWRAEAGRPGGPKAQTGRRGRDRIVAVPPGTVVYDATSGELLADLVRVGDATRAASGGRGGHGNEHFKSPTDQAPKRATRGAAGQRRRVRLELKLIADVGIVGKPNAGKSTLLARLSAARPKIASYPFTTLEPQLGIAELPGYRRLVLADLPGLIEGASSGSGLGHDFLRHVERTRILVHLLEVDPTDGTDPVDNYHVIRRELAGHAPALVEKPERIALNKVETLGGDDQVEAAQELLQQALQAPVQPISAVTGQGCAALLEACWEMRERAVAGEAHRASEDRQRTSAPH